MTVATLLFGDSFPIAVTDCLISAQNVVASTIYTPITISETRPGSNGYVPIGLAKKQWLSVYRNHYILFSGTVNDAEALAKYIDGKLAYEEKFYDDDLHQQAVELVTRDKLNVAFIVVSKSQDHYISHYYHAASLIQKKPFGQIVIIGSGTSELIRATKSLVQHLPPSALNFDAKAPEAIGGYMLLALSLVGQLTLDYANPTSNLARDSTGGNFHITYFPELYGWSKADLPPPLLCGSMQIWLRLEGHSVYLDQFIWSSSPLGDSPIQILSYRGNSLVLTADSVDIPEKDIGGANLGDRLRDAEIFSGFQCSDIEAFQLVVHITSTNGGGSIKRSFLPFASQTICFASLKRNVYNKLQLHLARDVMQNVRKHNRVSV